MAYLILRAGASCTIRELAGILFEDSEFDSSQQAYMQQIITAMMKSLREVGAEACVIRSYNSLAVDASKIDCDYYRFKRGDKDVLKNFDHSLVLREDDPLLPAILDVYEKQGIKNGHPRNTMKGEAFKTELATAYPDCRLVVTKETMTVEGMIKIVYDLLKDKLNIVKLTFTSGVNAASAEFESRKSIDRCPLCGISLDENGVCPKCGYRK